MYNYQDKWSGKNCYSPNRKPHYVDLFFISFPLRFCQTFFDELMHKLSQTKDFSTFFFEKINFHCFIWKHKLKQFTELWIIKEKSLKLFQADSLYLLTWPCVFTIIPAWYFQIDSLNVFPFRAIQKELWFIPI